MILNSSLVNELFRGFHIQRWNDRIRPMELIEMDKHAHKMFVAYCLAKYEEDKGEEIKWQKLIKDGIYELLRRIVISDIKSPIYHKVKQNKKAFRELNKYVFSQLNPKIEEDIIREELDEFLFREDNDDSPTQRILDAAHIYSSYWEFNIIKQSNPFSYQNIRIETELLNTLDRYKNLEGIRKLTNKHTISNFIDLCGQLRFQYRWAQIPRIPKTSVLGHSLLVAIINFFFVRENSQNDKRLYNAFFGGLFHDLPEAVTRDIISPVKKSSEEFDNLIKIIERELANNEIFPLIKKKWHREIEYFIVDEFDNKIQEKDQSRIIEDFDEFNSKYDKERYNPFDGKTLRAADQLSAFLEAWNSINSGIKTEELFSAAQNIKNIYQSKEYGKLRLGSLYSNFKL